MRGVESYGMILCAFTKVEDGKEGEKKGEERVEIISPSPEANVGEILFVDENKQLEEVVGDGKDEMKKDNSILLNLSKKNSPWFVISPKLSVNKDKILCLDNIPLVTSISKTNCSAASLKNTYVS